MNTEQLTIARKNKLKDLSAILPKILTHLSGKSIYRNQTCQQNAFIRAYWMARNKQVIDTAFPPNIIGGIYCDPDSETVEEAANYIRQELDLGKYTCKKRCLAAQFKIIDEVADDIELPAVLAAHFDKNEAVEPVSKRVRLG